MKNLIFVLIMLFGNQNVFADLVYTGQIKEITLTDLDSEKKVCEYQQKTNKTVKCENKSDPKYLEKMKSFNECTSALLALPGKNEDKDKGYLDIGKKMTEAFDKCGNEPTAPRADNCQEILTTSCSIFPIVNPKDNRSVIKPGQVTVTRLAPFVTYGSAGHNFYSITNGEYDLDLTCGTISNDLSSPRVSSQNIKDEYSAKCISDVITNLNEKPEAASVLPARSAKPAERNGRGSGQE
jgi:hypothetical protein